MRRASIGLLFLFLTISEFSAQETFLWIFENGDIKVEFNWYQKADSIKYEFGIENFSNFEVYSPLLNHKNDLTRIFSLDSSIVKMGNGVTLGLYQFPSQINLQRIKPNSLFRVQNSFFYNDTELPDLHLNFDFIIEYNESKFMSDAEKELLYDFSSYLRSCQRIHFIFKS